MAQAPSDTILVAIRITLRIRESKVRNPDPPDRRRFVLSECISSCTLRCACTLIDLTNLRPTASLRLKFITESYMYTKYSVND